MTKIDLPYVRVENANELLKKLTPSILQKEDLTVTVLSKFLETSKSTMGNLIRTLKAFKLMEGRGKFKFTADGKNYTSYLIKNEDNKAKQLLKKILENTDYMHDLKQKLSQKGKLTIAEIGNQVALHYSQKWENPLTVRTHGAAIASAMGFSEIAYYRNGYLFIKKVHETSESISAPYVSSKKIFTILKKLLPTGKNLNELSAKVNTKVNRLSGEVSCCIELGFVERPYKGFYKPTQEGESLISPYTSEDQQKMLFRNALLNSAYEKIIKNLSKLPKINVIEVGNALKFEFRKTGAQWTTEKTVRTYANKFIDWLIFAELLKKIGKDDYTLKLEVDEVKSLNEDQQDTIPRKISSISLIRNYMLGKNIGLVLNPNLDYELAKEIVEKIIAICREDEKLKQVLEDWQSDYKLFLDIKDHRLFIRDIKTLERTLGVKET